MSTFVNGMRCERAGLKNLDEVTFGVPGLRVIFQEGPHRDSAASMLLSRFASDSDVSELEKLRLFLEAARSLGGGLVVHDVLRNMLDYRPAPYQSRTRGLFTCGKSRE